MSGDNYFGADVCINKKIEKDAVEMIYLTNPIEEKFGVVGLVVTYQDFGISRWRENCTGDKDWDCKLPTVDPNLYLTANSGWNDTAKCTEEGEESETNILTATAIFGDKFCLRFNHNDAGDGCGFFRVKQFHIKYNSGPEEIVRVAEPGSGITQAWTDRFYMTDPNNNNKKIWNTKNDCGNKDKWDKKNRWGPTSLLSTPRSYIDKASPYNNYCPYNGVDELKNLFAKSYGFYSLDTGKMSYTSQLQNNWNPKDLSSSSEAPRTRAVIKQTDGTEIEDPEGHPMTINGKPSGDFDAKSDSLTAVLKFYAWADKNHMPIREVVIDWGDGGDYPSPTGLNSEMMGKNRREDCNEDPLDGEGWGGSPQACTNGYFQFVHTYICQQGGPGYNRNDNRCYFKPRVFVKDNWGWCNGGSYAGDNTCYPDRGKEYDGQIILIPAEE